MHISVYCRDTKAYFTKYLYTKCVYMEGIDDKTFVALLPNFEERNL